MSFHHVSISGLASVRAPQRLTSQDINHKLAQTRQRLGITTDVLEDVAGIVARHLWPQGTPPSQVASQAGVLALVDANLAPSDLGLLINTSVSRDFLEPSTASIVAGNMGVSPGCQNFDLSNACLGFLNGMDMAAHMIENGAIQHALVVDGETAELIYEKTIERLARPDATAEEFRNDLAALTLGSGAAAMVLSRADLAPGKPLYLGGVSRSATQWNGLCRGNLDRMTTDTKGLLVEGMRLATLTFAAAQEELGWRVEDFDEFVIHQVSRVHTGAFMQALGVDAAKVHTVFSEQGNIGPASLPIVLNELRQLGRLTPGKHIALLGIGSGLNCTMAQVVWA